MASTALDSFKRILGNRVGLSVVIGVVAGVAAVLLRPHKLADEEGRYAGNDNRFMAFAWGFATLFLTSYVLMYLWDRQAPSAPRPDLETVMRHTHGGDPGF